MMILQNRVDLAFNPFSISKEHWFSKHPEFKLASRSGSVLSVLVFNLNDPRLSLEVRQALASALDLSTYLKHKTFGFFERANSIAFHPGQAREILRRAGLGRLLWIATPTTIGLENALIVREWLRAVGVELHIELLEKAAYARALRTGKFQLANHLMRDGKSAPSWADYLHSQGSKNVAHYASAQVDRLIAEGRPAEARALAEKDLPYLPLWYWNNVAVLGKRMQGMSLPDIEKSLSTRGDLRPLLEVLLRAHDSISH